MPIRPENKAQRNRFLNAAARAARLSPCYSQKPCEFCTKLFSPYRLKNTRFCSTLCKKRWDYKSKNPRVEKKCNHCGNIFIPRGSNKAMYCSTKCNAASVRCRIKGDMIRLESRRKRNRIYSKTDNYRIGQINHKARRRCAEKNGNITLREWENILKNHSYKCVYCGTKERKLTMDHVMPLSKGGEHNKSNIVPACQPCNSSKCNKILEIVCQ